MELVDLFIYKGRNIFSHKPTMKMIVDVGPYGDTPTKEIPGFNENLLHAFPNLKTHTCGLGHEGGFLKRLEEGTYLAHVLEHVIIDIQNSLGHNVKYGKTRGIADSTRSSIIYEYENEICALECSKSALFILNCLVDGLSIEIDEFLEYLTKIKLDTELGPSTAAIVNEAKARHIPVTRIGYESLVRLGYGKHSKVIEATLSDNTSCIACDISCNKQLTKEILDEHKIPVPYGKVVYSEISAVMVAHQIGMPVVVKPFDGNQGKGVHLNLSTEADIRAAFLEASNYSSGIIVEKYAEGKDYRILVVGDRVRAVSRRIPALVTGDGQHTIQQLIDTANRNEQRGEHHEKPLTKIKLDNVVLNVLQKKKMDVNYIPKENEEVTLRENGNLSTGGLAIDYTDSIHPDNAEIAVNAAKAIGIDIAGVDLVAEDISKSIRHSSGAVIEVNAAPGIRMHLYPSEGQPRNVAKDIVDYLFPDEDSLAFPIVAVTGTNGKTTTARIVAHVLALTGKTVGMTSTSGTFINDQCICKGDNSGANSARALLTNKSIDAAVLETARGGIIRQGLGYDLADVGILTNISDDHLGLDGIETLEDLAHVKSLVVEAVKPNGYAVINAEDPIALSCLDRVRSNVVLFYKNNCLIPDADSYVHAFVQDGLLKIRDGESEFDVIRVSDIPIAMGGVLECNIENCLAAVGALYALHIPLDVIANGLSSFRVNPGRFQLFETSNCKVVLDYAHNKGGYEEITKLCRNLPHNRLIGVIGMPGDRPDTMIQEVGQLCANAFDQIIIKEDSDLRGREALEVADLLRNALLDSAFPLDRLTVIPNEAAAMQDAISRAQKDDMVVVLYENIDPLLELLSK